MRHKTNLSRVTPCVCVNSSHPAGVYITSVTVVEDKLVVTRSNGHTETIPLPDNGADIDALLETIRAEIPEPVAVKALLDTIRAEIPAPVDTDELIEAVKAALPTPVDARGVVTGRLVGADLELLGEGDEVLATVELASLVPATKADRFLSAVVYDLANKQLVFTTEAEGEDAQTITVPMSDVIPVINAASTTQSGIVELATVAEAKTGTAADLAVTPAGLAEALAARLNGLSVGGRNYLFSTADATKYDVFSAGVASERDSTGLLKVTNNNDRNVNISINTKVKSTHTLTAGTELVVSYDYKTNANNLNYTFLLTDKGNYPLGNPATAVISDGAWHRAVFKYVPNVDVANPRLLAGAYNAAPNQYLSVRNAKLELGTIPTDWTPAPEDATDNDTYPTGVSFDEATRELVVKLNTGANLRMAWPVEQEEECTPFTLGENQTLRNPRGSVAHYCMHSDGSVSSVQPKKYVYTHISKSLDVVAGDLWVIAPDGQERQARAINWNNPDASGISWGRKPRIEYRPEGGEAVPLIYNEYINQLHGSIPELHLAYDTELQIDETRTIETYTLNLIDRGSWFASTPTE